MPGPRVRHPVRGCAALGPERLPSYRRSARAEALAVEAGCRARKEPGIGSHAPFCRRSPPPRVDVAVGLLRPGGLAPACLAARERRDRRRVSVDVVQSTLSKIEYPHSTRFPVHRRGRSPETRRRARASRRASHFCSACLVAARAFSSLEHRSLSAIGRSLRRVALQHLGARVSPVSSPTPAALATIAGGNPPTGDHDHRRERVNAATAPMIDRAPASTSTHSGLHGSRGFAAAIPVSMSLFAGRGFPRSARLPSAPEALSHSSSGSLSPASLADSGYLVMSNGHAERTPLLARHGCPRRLLPRDLSRDRRCERHGVCGRSRT
jgi:hypothetical protein